MSLYHESARLLTDSQAQKTSIKSLVYGKKTWKSDPKTLFALSTEAAKWSSVLSEVVERSGILKLERGLTPVLALVLVHDLLLARRGVALPATHGLHAAVLKHKARLTAELTKARLRRGCGSLEALRAMVEGLDGGGEGHVTDGDSGRDAVKPFRQPRWVRINMLRTTLEEQIAFTFKDYTVVASLHELSGAASKLLYFDEHVPSLIAIPPTVDITSTQAYRTGRLILQDKASCFPAYLLDPASTKGDVIDACAAPGNKTTHLAALLHEAQSSSTEIGQVIACEKDEARSQILEKMVKLAGGSEVIEVLAKQDFTKLNPDNKAYANVTALLLDPSCSGSGIVGRDQGAVVVHLPDINAVTESAVRGKKRKHSTPAAKQPSLQEPIAVEEEEVDAGNVEESSEKLKARLANLSAFQLRLLLHAMRFPAATRISYSTCSIHPEENEHVICAALFSHVARERGWRVMRRSEQVDGMRAWQKRGWKEACSKKIEEVGGDDFGDTNAEEVAEACIRCEKGSEEGTMGFFVAGFVRDEGFRGSTNGDAATSRQSHSHEGRLENGPEGQDDDDEWHGFEDEG
ncbi:hypothetical protein LTR62_007967 [Meristemomyces frigidus]|uniref:SAM-dependent MTase RsmB/NOP-type domain-containing protein n=1 Tax=Meristemomyces frigidus TaxID=1508187 RepID=A0AAN7TPS9_9PEZI|nr:hypothetical protein LTR62_007967 [Meristemomyces frigidus]